MSIFKKIGKILSAPARGIGHALRTSHIPGLSNIGGAVENVGNAVAGKGAFLRDIGKAGKNLAPVAGLIPGAGPLIGGALGAGGEFLDRGTKAKLRDVILQGGVGALSGLAGQKFLGGRGVLGIPKALGLGGGAPGGLSGAGAAETGGGGILGGIGHVGKSALTSLGIFKPSGQFDPLRAAQLGLGAAGIIHGAGQQGQADQLRRQAFSNFQPGPAPDLSGVFANTGNPYATDTYGAKKAALRSVASGY